jgi:serine/threonine protein kinase
MTSRAGVDEDTRILSHLNGTESFPIYFGTTHVPCQKGKRIYTHPVVIMELLGESVDTFARASVYKSASYRIKEALIVGRQVLDGLKILHTELGLIMHDLYPRNVVYSRDTLNKTAKLLDFGESSPIYLDGVVMYNYLNRLYTSLREDRREPLGPRDDIERLVYLMVYIVGSGIMPWASDDPDWLVSRKAAMKTSDVCSFLPQEIVEILEYARNGISKAEDLPDYDRIRYLIETALLQLPQNEDADTLNSSRLYR